MASKLEIMAKLRDRVSELEREKRDTDKRYAEQVSQVKRDVRIGRIRDTMRLSELRADDISPGLGTICVHLDSEL